MNRKTERMGVNFIVAMTILIIVWVVFAITFSKRVSRVGNVTKIVCKIDVASTSDCKVWDAQFVFSESAEQTKPLHVVIESSSLHDKVQGIMNHYGEMKFSYMVPYVWLPFLIEVPVLLDAEPVGHQKEAFFGGSDVSTLPALKNFDGRQTKYVQVKKSVEMKIKE